MTALPARPDLGQLRKQAKELARAESVALSEAQFRVARRYGFPSWPQLQAYVRRIAEYGPDVQHAYHQDVEHYRGRAGGLLASAEDGTPGAREAFERHEQPLNRTGALTVVAREHGFRNWRALRAHVAELPKNGEPFSRAYQLVEAHDVDSLTALLDEAPHLASARGTNGNDLLGMASATHDERLVRILLDHGADPARANAHGWTALHQAAYSNMPLIADVLLETGAPLDVSGRGDGGTPLIVALFWGNQAVAEKLATHEKSPHNLRVAAGLGDATLLDELVSPKGTLAPAAGAHREFYRPHSGFPFWRPSDHPTEILDESLSWAARNDRTEALRTLAARGANLNADVYRGTALTWAAARGHSAATETLLSLGVDVNQVGTFGGPQHGVGVTALHLAAQGDHLEVIEILANAGADLTARDALWDSTPEGWAEACDSPAAQDLLHRLR
ncbi:ankyrin repeat domain-containing protein [Amycolatopsis jejuensis]|uniref:ankyrin repeat domain-containing protein n=1 Tax=Amycolatopsis jejuensis TaxID=330084 RepID=UPI0005263618|nr:ankyrin repeat domain-containing protein [Amycolatopsis jejuensis]